MSNKDYTGEWEYKPAELNKDGLETTLEVEHKCVPDKKEWEAEAELKVGGYSSGVVSGWSELQFNTNSKQEHELTFSQNILCEKKYHTAFKLVSSLGEKKSLSEAYGILAFNDLPFGNLWLRGAFMSKLFSVGASWKHGKS